MKLLAFYLPQYHQTPENDKWWGEGFTEWTNVKKAKPIFKNQIQPKVPLKYYDLMNKSTVEWQTGLMKKSGIYGFCYFHYWFTGRRILYKPAENLLKWKDINQPFCFSWANATWARTWSAVNAALTSWVPEDKKGFDDGILIEQTYGDENNWIEHYKYLRDFFLDDRYIKVDNKPMFLIYKLKDIPHAEDMFALWDKLALEDGFDGLHLVSMNEYPQNNDYICAVAKYGYYSKYDSFNVNFQGWYNLIASKFGKENLIKPHIYNYKTVWKNLVKEKPPEGIKTYPGAVVTYDETPRRGKDATFLSGASPKIFEKYLIKQIKKAEDVCHSDFIFIDAWNEWGEGNYLEPDKEHGCAYLRAVRRALIKTGNWKEAKNNE